MSNKNLSSCESSPVTPNKETCRQNSNELDSDNNTSNDQDDETDTISASTNSKSDLTTASKKAKLNKRFAVASRGCIGYDANIANFHSRFPHHIQDLEKDKISFVVSDKTFHSLNCSKNEFNTNGETNLNELRPRR